MERTKDDPYKMPDEDTMKAMAEALHNFGIDEFKEVFGEDETPLHLSALADQHAEIRNLVQFFGPEILNLKTSKGFTPLDVAKKMGHERSAYAISMIMENN